MRNAESKMVKIRKAMPYLRDAGRGSHNKDQKPMPCGTPGGAMVGRYDEKVQDHRDDESGSAEWRSKIKNELKEQYHVRNYRNDGETRK